MYKRIEKFYKKESPYNIVKKKTFWIYYLGAIIALVFNICRLHILMMLTFAATILLIKSKCEKILNTKFPLKIGRKEKSVKVLPDIIRDQEYKMFKNYVIKNNLYGKKTLLCIIDHYRNLIKPKIVENNLLAILSIAIPILLSFYTGGVFDFKAFTVALPYIFSFIVVIVVLYFIYKEFIQFKDFFKGVDGMNDRLEEIFSELYIECVNDSLIVDHTRDKRKKSKTSKKKK